MTAARLHLCKIKKVAAGKFTILFHHYINIFGWLESSLQSSSNSSHHTSESKK